MDFLKYVNNENDTSVMDDNNTKCDEENMDYIPTVEEYREAMGGYWIALLTFGSVTTVLLYGLFIQQVWFTLSNSHKVYRKHIYWLISIYPFVTLMTTVSIIVPRVHEMSTAIKIVYMSIGVGHFADLTLLMYGNENKMFNELKDSPMSLDLLPLFCYCRWLPTIETTKLRLMVLKWTIWQMKWIQAFYFVIMYVIRTSLQHPDGSMTTGATFFWLSLWLTVFNFSSFLAGVYALNIIGDLSNVKLRRFRYTAKSWAVKGLTITVKLQKVVLFDLLGLFEIFPCLGPKITPIVYQNTLENSVFLVEMVIFGLFSYFMYRLPEFKDYEELGIPTTQSGETEKSVAKADSGSTGSESAYGSTDSRDISRGGAEGQKNSDNEGFEMRV